MKIWRTSNRYYLEVNTLLFSSSEFLFVFLPVVLILYFNPFAKTLTYKNVVLLSMSLLFYAWGEPLFVFVMIFMSFVNWILSLCIEKKRRYQKWFVFLAVFADLLLLGVFKYLSFITENIARVTGNDSLIIKIALPIGISFYTFQMMSYIFDVANEKAKVQKNFFNVLMYITMFPQLIAGPIVRYETVSSEITNRNTTAEDFSRGICRFVKGLTKKVVLANNISLLADKEYYRILEKMAYINGDMVSGLCLFSIGR